MPRFALRALSHWRCCTCRRLRQPAYTRGIGDSNDAYTSTVLGTSALPTSAWQTMRAELRDEQARQHSSTRGQELQSCVQRAELSHMESPESDERFVQSVHRRIDDFFASIPLPDDPMKAALAPTDAEMQEEAAAELVKEAVRELYQRRQRARATEDARLQRAAALFEGQQDGRDTATLSTNEAQSRPLLGDTTGASSKLTSDMQQHRARGGAGAVTAPASAGASADRDSDVDALQRELDQLRARVRAVEAAIHQRQR